MREIGGAVKKDAVGRGNIYYYDPRKLKAEPGFNPRIDFSGHEDLVNFIDVNGVPGVYKIYKKGSDYFIKDGHRRQRAVMELIGKGNDIKKVACIYEQETEEERTFGLLSTNEGKAFNSVEKGDLYLRLIGFGWTQMDIAHKAAKSQSHVSNCILLARTPKRVRDLMTTGQVPESTVLKALTALDDDGDYLDEKKLTELITKSSEESVKAGEGRRGASRRVLEKIGDRRVSPQSRVKLLAEFIEENSIILQGKPTYEAVKTVHAFMTGEIGIQELLSRIS